MSDVQDRWRGAPAREPVFNLPWPVSALIASLVAAHVARLWLGVPADRFALISSDLAAGRWTGLITHQFVHGGWTHLLMNSAFILAFGAPVARFLGASPRAGLAFFGFFLVCGVVAAAAFAGLSDLLAAHRPGVAQWALVGASGSASGLMAAAARLIQGRGRLGSIAGPVVVGMTTAWIAINVVLGLSGLTPGAGGAPVAWQAHILGYLCGLVVIGPFGWLAGGRRDHVIAL